MASAAGMASRVPSESMRANVIAPRTIPAIGGRGGARSSVRFDEQPDAAECDDLHGELGVGVAREPRLQRREREQRRCDERPARPDDLRRERVQREQAERAEDRWDEEQTAVAAHRPAQREQGGEEVQEVRDQPVAGDREAVGPRREGDAVAERALGHVGQDLVRARDRAPGVDVHRGVAVGEDVLGVRYPGDGEQREADRDRCDRGPVRGGGAFRTAGTEGQRARPRNTVATIEHACGRVRVLHEQDQRGDAGRRHPDEHHVEPDREPRGKRVSAGESPCNRPEPWRHRGERNGGRGVAC